MKTIPLLLEAALLLFTFSCNDTTPPPESPANAPPPQAASAPSAAPSAAPSTASTPATTPQDACTPNVGAACAKDSDCAQCALVPPRVGGKGELVSTTVQCISATCTKTGCPKDPCPQGKVCQGCVANLPCSCASAPLGH